jgi:hypothetical protein
MVLPEVRQQVPVEEQAETTKKLGQPEEITTKSSFPLPPNIK